MDDLKKRQAASVKSFEKIDKKESILDIYFLKNDNGGARVLKGHHRYRRALIHAGLEWQHALGMSSEACIVLNQGPCLQLIKPQASKGRQSRL